MFEFDETSLFECKHPHGDYPPEKPRFTFTEEVEHTAREMRMTISRLLTFEKRLQEKFDDMLKHITSDNVIFKDTFAESYRLFLESAKNEINTFESNVDASLTLFKETISSDYANLSEECATQISEYYQNFVDELTGYKTELNETYDNFRDAIESRLTQYNATYLESFQTYTAGINNKFSATEKDLNDSYARFVADVQRTVTEFKNTWANTINTRLDGQDAIINDALLYMKTNFTDAVENFIQTMIDNGEFISIIESEVFSDFNKRLIGVEGAYVSPVMYGAKGDGATNDTNAMQTALNTGKVVDLLGKTYKVTSLRIQSGSGFRNGTIVLTGDGNILESAGTSSTNPVKNVTIQNVIFDGDGIASGGVYVRYGENIIIENCHFVDMYSDKTTAFGVHLRNCKNSSVKNCTVNGVEATPNGSIGDSIGSARGILFTDTVNSISSALKFSVQALPPLTRK